MTLPLSALCCLFGCCSQAILPFLQGWSGCTENNNFGVSFLENVKGSLPSFIEIYRRIAGGIIAWIAGDCDRDRADNQQLIAVYSPKLQRGTKHWLCCDQGDSSGAGKPCIQHSKHQTSFLTQRTMFFSPCRLLRTSWIRSHCLLYTYTTL